MLCQSRRVDSGVFEQQGRENCRFCEERQRISSPFSFSELPIFLEDSDRRTPSSFVYLLHSIPRPSSSKHLVDFPLLPKLPNCIHPDSPFLLHHTYVDLLHSLRRHSQPCYCFRSDSSPEPKVPHLFSFLSPHRSQSFLEDAKGSEGTDFHPLRTWQKVLHFQSPSSPNLLHLVLELSSSCTDSGDVDSDL